jgi:hypothetical protein
MDSVAKTRRAVIATIPALIAAFALAAFTPSERAAASPPSPRSTFRVHSSDAPVHSSDAQRVFGPLDLRAPADFPAARAATLGVAAVTAAESSVDSSPVPFPSPRRPARSAPVDDLSALGATGPRMKAMSRAEELTRRIHREGLPVARLWESHSALVSLGLNARGKPGIWLIQKVP